jgi:hypothetical protein
VGTGLELVGKVKRSRSWLGGKERHRTPCIGVAGIAPLVMCVGVRLFFLRFSLMNSDVCTGNKGAVETCERERREQKDGWKRVKPGCECDGRTGRELRSIYIF